jgi:hypothetical protein
MKGDRLPLLRLRSPRNPCFSTTQGRQIPLFGMADSCYLLGSGSTLPWMAPAGILPQPYRKE